MPIFNVYLKEGKTFSLTFEKFECKDRHFIIYESPSLEASDGFLSFDPVAAIVPRIQPRSNEIEGYRVELKNDQSVTVHAHYFSNKHADHKHSGVKFYIKLSDAGEPREVKNVYIATSEVIAITPAEGFRMGRSRSLEDR